MCQAVRMKKKKKNQALIKLNATACKILVAVVVQALQKKRGPLLHMERLKEFAGIAKK
ncbi:unnamed protein product [Callosobruchus maculatus]|uniref:Uncharacterized protein n=1 Tax=Callosobruchus maculatus TaxID=64391 RepID=A0A653DUG4_CALMS|nr:unnamed protein product [Callosobruchus maculatus]